MSQEKLIDFIPEFLDALTTQLEADDKRWGDTWRKRGLKGQERRTMERYRDYYDMFQNNGTPMPWMKIVGGAFICWVRENHPELLLCTTKMTKEEQVKSIAIETQNASDALYLDNVHTSISDVLAQATYCGRKEEFSVEKFRAKMVLVAGYCLLASGDDIDVVLTERLRQDKIWGDDFDRMNTANDWHAFIAHYLAKALRPNEPYSENMVKACGIAQAAILMVDRYGAPAPRHYENLPGAGATCEKCGRPEGKHHHCEAQVNDGTPPK